MTGMAGDALQVSSILTHAFGLRVPWGRGEGVGGGGSCVYLPIRSYICTDPSGTASTSTGCDLREASPLDSLVRLIEAVEEKSAAQEGDR